MDFTGYLFWGGLLLTLSAGMMLAVSSVMAKAPAHRNSTRRRKNLFMCAPMIVGVIILSAGLVTATVFLPYAPHIQRVPDQIQSGWVSGEGTPSFVWCGDRSPSAKPKPRFSGHIVGISSWYGRKFEGRRTASGEIFRSHKLTLASRVLPLGSRVEITNLDNGQRLIARVNDRGPYIPGRRFDVSQGVAQKLAFQRQGLANLRVKVLTAFPEEISTVR